MRFRPSKTQPQVVLCRDLVTPALLLQVLVIGPAWPAIYAALGSVYIGTMQCEGLLNAVHLDHMMALRVRKKGELLSHTGETIHLTSWAGLYAESASGRVVFTRHTTEEGTVLARLKLSVLQFADAHTLALC